MSPKAAGMTTTTFSVTASAARITALAFMTMTTHRTIIFTVLTRNLIFHFFGVELEADHGNEKDAAARDVTFGDLSYVKHDGSLTDDGIEIVTHPCSLRYHLEQFPWDEILSSLADYGFRSHDTSTCGLHVHVSRSAFGETSDEQDLTAAKSDHHDRPLLE